MVLGVVTQDDLLYFGVGILIVFLLLMVAFAFGWWVSKNQESISPYTGKPLRSASDVYWITKGKVLDYLYKNQDYDNQLVDFDKAALCRETGRIFPNCITWWGGIKVDWNFIRKRHPGHFVSWGSLTDEQKLLIRIKHTSIEGFQTEHSSPTPAPRQVEPEYAYATPGPLYVDLETAVLMGWKVVPETELEVLVVQRPAEQYLPGLGKMPLNRKEP